MTLLHYEIPDAIHRRIKAAAALKGQTLKGYVIDALTEAAARDDKAGKPRASR